LTLLDEAVREAAKRLKEIVKDPDTSLDDLCKAVKAIAELAGKAPSGRLAHLKGKQLRAEMRKAKRGEDLDWAS